MKKVLLIGLLALVAIFSAKAQGDDRCGTSISGGIDAEVVKVDGIAVTVKFTNNLGTAMDLKGEIKFEYSSNSKATCSFGGDYGTVSLSSYETKSKTFYFSDACKYETGWGKLQYYTVILTERKPCR